MRFYKPDSTKVERWSGPNRRFINLGTLVIVGGLCCVILSLPLRAGGGLLRFAQDDFYYYLKPAQNLAAGHGPTFDGTTPTNGFHPLYFLLLTIASFWIHTLLGIFRLLWVTDVASATSIFLVARRIFARVAPNPWLSNALALTLTLPCIPLLCNQMEVTLAIPLGLLFLSVGFTPFLRYTPARCAALGLLGALTTLARLDASILVFTFLVALLLVRESRAAITWPHLFSFTAAFFPLLLVYIAINQHFFHVLLPISGVAKELRHGMRPSQYLIGSFSGISLILVNTSIVTAVLARAMRRHLEPQEKTFLFAATSAPFLFYGIEMLISDWPLWNWYFYSLRYALAATLLLVGILWSRPSLAAEYPMLRAVRNFSWFPAILYAATVLVLCRTRYKVDHWMVEIQHASYILETFEHSHPGKYAMGDRAGMFAYITAAPVLQTEGLVMDKSYIEHIRAQDDLRSVLSSYGVNYYVAFVFERHYKRQFSGNCFHAKEPSIAGPDSLRMRSDFCEPPIYEFPGFDGKYLIYAVNPT